jgi:hypothetical protein
MSLFVAIIGGDGLFAAIALVQLTSRCQLTWSASWGSFMAVGRGVYRRMFHPITTPFSGPALWARVRCTRYDVIDIRRGPERQVKITWHWIGGLALAGSH